MILTDALYLKTREKFQTLTKQINDMIIRITTASFYFDKNRDQNEFHLSFSVEYSSLSKYLSSAGSSLEDDQDSDFDSDERERASTGEK